MVKNLDILVKITLYKWPLFCWLSMRNFDKTFTIDDLRFGNSHKIPNVMLSMDDHSFGGF